MSVPIISIKGSLIRKSREFWSRGIFQKVSFQRNQHGNILGIVCWLNVGEMRTAAYVSMSACLCLPFFFPHTHPARSTFCLWCHKMWCRLGGISPVSICICNSCQSQLAFQTASGRQETCAQSLKVCAYVKKKKKKEKKGKKRGSEAKDERWQHLEEVFLFFSPLAKFLGSVVCERCVLKIFHVC